jgi:hypothetical protein
MIARCRGTPGERLPLRPERCQSLMGASKWRLSCALPYSTQLHARSAPVYGIFTQQTAAHCLRAPLNLTAD